jgi:hypothetical protein
MPRTGLEVALAEAQRAVPLDELVEDGRPVADRLGEDLEQVAVLVAVDQDLALFSSSIGTRTSPIRARSSGRRSRCRGVEELHAVVAQQVDGAQDVAVASAMCWQPAPS